MSDPRTAGRPAQYRSEQQRRRAIAEKKRRRRRARIYFRIKQAILILAALAIGYSLGLRAGRVSGEAAPTLPPAPSEAQAVQTQPMETGPSDTVAPQIMGVNKLAVFMGSSIAYRSGILVSDDTDPAPKLSVDSSQVNLSAPGTYPVIYTATDSAGNATSVETTITVSEAPTTYVDEELIKETADALLAEIITDEMTKEEQINAVYDWIAGHCYYIEEFDKSDYLQAAYLMMTTNRGDCYGFYAVSRLFFDRMGLPNLTVSRLPNETRTSNHWWNMVSLDGGESWYHFDSTPPHDLPHPHLSGHGYVFERFQPADAQLLLF